jgi:hypothetical protein
MFFQRYSAIFAVVTALAHGQQNVKVVAVDPADRLSGGTVLGEWATAGNLDGWTGSNVTGLAAGGGFLTGDDNSATLDASISRTAISGGPDLDLGFNDYLQLRLKLPAAYAGDVKFEFGTTVNTGFAATRVFVLPAASIPKDGAFHTYRLDLGLEVFWRDSLRDLRITPLVAATGHFEIDYMEVGDVAGTAPALNLDTNFLAPLTANNTTRLIGKHVCVWWDSASTTFTTSHARRAVRMCEESYQAYCSKLGYNEPFREFNSTTTPRYKINFITWYGGYWAGGYKNRGHLNIDAGGLNDEGWGNPAPHEFGHVVQMAQPGNLAGGHWESHANYLRSGRNLHFYAAIPGCIPAIDNLTRNSNYRPDHKRHIYADQRYYLSLDDYGTQFGLPTNYAAIMWRDGASGQTLVNKLAGALPVGTSVKDVACECLKHWPMLDFVEKTRIRSQHWGTTADRASHFWNQGAQLIPQQDQPGWWRVPLERAPDRWAYQMHDLTASAGATITAEFRGMDMPGTGEDWRWCLAAISAGDVVRYSPVWAPGTQSFALTAGESQVFLIVTATPNDSSLDLESQSNTKPVDKHADRLRYAYEVRLVNATPAVHQYSVANPSGYHTHGNGGGIVGPDATVAAAAYVGPNAKVVGSARVLGTARVEDYAVIQGSATVQGSAIVSGSALIEGSALVEGAARVRDRAHLSNGAAVRGRALICGYSKIENTTVTDDAVVRGCAYPFGGGTISGTAIMDHDYSMGWNVSSGVHFSHIPWGGWWDAFYAQTLRTPRGLIASYRTQETDGEQWWDEFGALHAQLRGSPLRTMDTAMGSPVMVFNGSNDFATLDRSVADTPLFSFSGWIKPATAIGTAEPLLFLGSSATMALKLVRGTTGQAVFTISDGTTTRTLTSTSVLPVNEWRNVAVTLDGTTGKLYIGGVSEATAAITLTPLAVLAANNGTAQQANYIGRDWGGGLFKGSLEDMRFYNVAMTAAEVRAEASRHGDLIGQFSPIAATDFNGTATTAESGVRNGRIRTLSAWVKPRTSDDVSNYEAVFDSDDERSGLQGCGLGLDAGKWVGRLDNVGNWATNVTATLGQWQHVALAFNGSTATLFINGVQAVTRSYSGPGNDAAAAGKCYRIGFSQTAEATATRQFFDGLILNARVHDRALTAAQIVLDSDGDGVTDNVEADAGSDPLNAQSLPVAPSTTSVASGNWHTTTTWDKLQIPGVETPVIVNTHAITITSAAANCNTLTLGGGGSVSASGRSLTVANPTINALNTTGGTLALNATSTLNITKTNTSIGLAGLTVASGTVLNITGELTVDSGKNLSGATLNTPKLTLAGGTLTIGALNVPDTGYLAGNGTVVGAVSVASGGMISPGSDTTISAITASSLTLDSGSTLTLNAASTSSIDQITVSTGGGLTINGGVITFLNGNGTARMTDVGTYKLIAYTGAIGGKGVSSLTVANKAQGRKYTFGTADGFVTLTLTSVPIPITYVGTDTTTKGAWRTTSVDKPLDVSGDDAYGSDGWMTANTGGGISNPSYATLAYIGGTPDAQLPNYMLVDQALMPAATVADERANPRYNWPVTPGSVHDMASITMTATKTFRVALLGDIRADGDYQYNSTHFRIYQTTGGTGDSGVQLVSPFDGSGKWLVFEITGSAGDVFMIEATAGSGGEADLTRVGLDSGYTTWATANGASNQPSEDTNNDGVANGVAYFMNATGLSTNPGINGTGKVTWPNGGNIPRSAYGTQFVVQTSTNLQNWVDVPGTDPKLSNTAGSVSYTLPTGAAKSFVRLKVTPN